MKIEVDAEGLSCPEPIMLLHKAIRESSHGDLIELKATDKPCARPFLEASAVLTLASTETSIPT